MFNNGLSNAAFSKTLGTFLSTPAKAQYKQSSILSILI
jgi:hypothetical protein